MKENENRTLTIHFKNYNDLARLKLTMQEIARAKRRIDFDNVIEYLCTLHKPDTLERFVKYILEG